MIHGSKIIFQIRIYDPFASGLDFVPNLPQGIGCLAPFAISKAARIEYFSKIGSSRLTSAC